MKGVAAGAVVSTSAFAGCSAVGSDQPSSVEEADEDQFPSVEVNGENLNQTDEFRRVNQAGGWGIEVTAYTTGHRYELADVTETVREKTMGAIDDPLVVFFATESNLEGTGTSLADVDRIAEMSTNVMRSQLESQGITDIQQVEPVDPLPDVDEDAQSVEFRGTYETPAIERTASLGNGEEVPIQIPSQDLEVAGMHTTWKPNDGTAIVGGGVYPTKDFETSSQSSVTGERNDGIDVQVIVDLDLEPDSYRERLNSLTESLA